MRWTTGLAVLLGTVLWAAPALLAQEEGDDKPPQADGDAGKADDEGVDPAPEKPKAYQLPERDRKKVEKELSAFLIPSKKTRDEEAEGIEKLAEKPIDGHSILEDVASFIDIANHARVFGSKIPRGGAVRVIKVPPEIHGFPGGVGTVEYNLWLPKDYRDKQLWPVIFCLPDTKAFPDTAQYIKDVWLKSDIAKEKYLIVAPTPSAKGKQWRNDDISYARAMITLRHVMGTFDADRKDGGPASDALRVFIDGGDMAAAVAARFTEMFAGAVLRDVAGSIGKIKLRESGGLNGLPAFCVVPEGKKRQRSFADQLLADNSESVVKESAEPQTADAAAAAEWMDALPRRGVPAKIQYTVHDSSFQRHHWINVLRFDGTAKDPVTFEATADRVSNTVTIKESGLIEFEVSLNDALVDLGRDVTIVVEEGDQSYVVFKGRLAREIGPVLTELIDTNQPWRVYPARVLVSMPAVRKAAAAAEAKKAAEAADQAETEKKGASAEVTGGTLDR